MNHDTVKAAFKNLPKITEVRLRHQRFVMLFFASAEAAQKALLLNGKTIKGNKISVEPLKKATPTRDRKTYCTTVYVGGIKGRTVKKQLLRHFAAAGEIDKVKIYMRPKVHAFVYFKSVAAAGKAVSMANIPFCYSRPNCKTPNKFRQKVTLDIKLSIRTRAFDKMRDRKSVV